MTSAVLERFEQERARSMLALELAEAEFRFRLDCRERARELNEYRAQQREWELARERRELWRGGVHRIFCETLVAVPVSEDRALFAQVVVGMACRELAIEEPKQLVFFHNDGAINGLAQWWLSSIAVRANLGARGFAVVLAHELRHLWQRGRKTDVDDEADAYRWQEDFYRRRELEIENAARLLQQE